MTPKDSLERRLAQTPADDSEALAARFAELAAQSGDAEVAYTTLDTPVGTASLACTARGLVAIALPNRPLEDLIDELASEISPRVVEAPRRLDRERRELDEYFEGKRREFDLPLDWTLARSGFIGKVLAELATLPYGATMTYGELAARAGNPRAHRAAGTACGTNPIPIVVPCHRITRAGGAIGNYGGGTEMKRWLLALEGALTVT